MKETIVVAIVISLLSVSCGLMTDPELALLKSQLEYGKENLARLEKAIAEGKDIGGELKEALLRQMDELKAKNAELGILIAKRLESGGVPPEFAGAGGAGATVLITLLWKLLGGQRKTDTRLKETRAVVLPAVAKLNGGGAGKK